MCISHHNVFLIHICVLLFLFLGIAIPRYSHLNLCSRSSMAPTEMLHNPIPIHCSWSYHYHHIPSEHSLLQGSLLPLWFPVWPNRMLIIQRQTFSTFDITCPAAFDNWDLHENYLTKGGMETKMALVSSFNQVENHYVSNRNIPVARKLASNI